MLLSMQLERGPLNFLSALESWLGQKAKHRRPVACGGVQVRAEGVQRNAARIDVDGLPHVGAVVYPGQAYYSKVDRATGALTFSAPHAS